MTLQRYLTRLIWLTILPVLALALALSYVQFAHERDDDRVEAQRLAVTLAREADLLLQARIDALRMLARSPLLDEPRWRELHREARGFVGGFGGHIVLVDAQRQLRLHTGVPFGNPLPPLQVPDGRDAVPLVFETGQAAVGDPFVGPVVNERVMAIAVPVPRDGNVALVLASVTPLRQLDELLDGMALPPDWTASLHDSAGRVIVQRSADGDGVPPGADDGALLHTVWATAAPWTVQLRIPHTTYAQHLAGLGSLLVAALLGVTLVSVLAGRVATRRLRESVRSLVEPAPPGARPEPIEEIREVRRLLDDALAKREAAAGALRQREEQLRGVFESASEAIVTADAGQHIVLANPAAARIFGRPLEGLVGASLGDLMPERFRARHHDEVERFGGSGAGTRAMGGRSGVVGLRADGSEFPAEGAISQVRLDGQILYTVILRDVTERREGEAAVDAARARLQTALESMNDGLVMVDSEGRVVELNTAFARMFGFAGKAECPRSLREFETLIEVNTLDGERVPPEQWAIARALRGEIGSGAERRLSRQDTGLGWIASLSFAPIVGVDGRRLGAVVTVRDVTERARLADELRASHAELRDSHAELARLVTAQQAIEEGERKRIARELHDELQQVLAAIKLDIAAIGPQMAADARGVPGLVARIDELASAAIVSSRRIVNDLRPPLLEELGPAAALETLARQFGARTGIVVEVQSDEGCRACGTMPDAVALCLYRATQEALNNVAKHAQARRVRIALSMPGGTRWRLVVSDDGRGMRAEDRRKPTSFGLRGMAERVRALGGSLRVLAPAGRGVTLEVEIGRVAAEEEAAV